MARFTFGGDIHDLVARPDSAAGGALKPAPGITVQFYSASSGGSPLTDYLVDADGNGTFETAALSITVLATGYLPDFQGPDGVSVLYYDPDPNDVDVRRVRLVARDAATPGIPTASTTTEGVVRLPSTAEVDAGVVTNRVTTVADVQRKINAHQTDPGAHPDLSAGLNSALTGLAGKVDKVDNVALMEQLPASDGVVIGTLPIRRATTGAVAVGSAIADDEAVPLAQARTLATNGATNDVRFFRLASTVSSAVNTAATFTAIPTLLVSDAATNQVWACEYMLHYRAPTTSGIQIRFKTGAVEETNVLRANSSFETDTTGYTAGNNSTTIARSTAGGGQSGTASMLVTSVNTTAASNWVDSAWFPASPGQSWSAGAYAKRAAGAARNVRIDVQYGDALGAVLLNQAGTNLLPTTTAFARAVNEPTTTVAPAGTTQVRARIIMAAPNTIGDATYFDAIQLEQGATLPAYGSTGGSGSSALSITGYWEGLTIAGTTSNEYARRVEVRYPVGAGTTGGFGAVGASADAVLTGSFYVSVGGTNLNGQRIELEFAQRVADATAVSIVAGHTTFARIS